MELDTVVQHYLTALLWSETADSGEPLDSTDYELSQAAINTAEGDCENFLEVHAALVAELPDWYTAAQLEEDRITLENEALQEDIRTRLNGEIETETIMTFSFEIV